MLRIRFCPITARPMTAMSAVGSPFAEPSTPARWPATCTGGTLQEGSPRGLRGRELLDEAAVILEVPVRQEHRPHARSRVASDLRRQLAVAEEAVDYSPERCEVEG